MSWREYSRGSHCRKLTVAIRSLLAKPGRRLEVRGIGMAVRTVVGWPVAQPGHEIDSRSGEEYI